MKLVIGLGNPGSRYAATRHNVGFMALDRLARKHGASITKRQCNALTALATVSGQRVCLAKPQTYMNLSGESVACLARFYRIAPEDILVIYDDRDLPVGKLRLRERGSAGGHRGMQSIIATLGTSDFPRLRIGIGRPSEMDAVDHVLGQFSAEERSVMDEALDRAVEAVEVALGEGLEAAMNRFN
ncbi:MAG: aminoacyl-tRNA hydrolase [Sphingomonadaceae bacterium]